MMKIPLTLYMKMKMERSALCKQFGVISFWIMAGSEKGRLWKTTGDLHPRLLVRIGRVFGIRSGYNFHRLVEHLSPQCSDLVRFDVGIVVVHVACTLYCS